MQEKLAMRTFVLFVAVTALVCAGRVQAANVIWYSFANVDTDIGFIDLLEGAGHNVTRIVEENPLTSPTMTTINSSDLIILARGVNSGSVDNTNMPIWNEQVMVPAVVLSAYLARNNRLGWVTGDGVPDLQEPTPLVAEDPSHPVFNGISFAADGVTMANDFNVVIDRGISTNTSPPVAGGIVIATNPVIADSVSIAEWPEGVTVTDETGQTAVLAAPRYLFNAGSRELDGAGVATAGKLDLTADGQQMFLNLVDYIVGGEPTLPGDFNQDGFVNNMDYDILVDNLGGHLDGPVGRAEGDIDFNGRVDLDDFGKFKELFPGALGQAQAIPEPASVILVASIGALLVLARVLGRRGRLAS
jgi:hypothetical protein